ncbi:hypothetical protein C8R43DRAFT_871689 [Mycena crocata]|nr:hypothetical protein C8R43DRAFT_871689 [Mycena crocata]
MNLDFGAKIGGLPLPQELLEILNQTYFLRILATEPETVIPDGKSLFSMMAHSRLKPESTEPVAVLHDRVEKAIHDAFWNQALEALSDPTPSIQIDRLKGLFFDVREAILPLFPKNHSILATLSAPVPPTASPLISTSLLLKEILAALRQRAAPARDPTIDGLLADLDTPLSPVAVSNPSSSIKASTSQLARLIINTMKAIIGLAEVMKTDINQFVLGSMTETQLRETVIQQAKQREKEIVLDIWGDSDKDGRQRIQALWQAWVDGLDERRTSEEQPANNSLTSPSKWIHRLIQVLGLSKAVWCPIPDLVSEPGPNDAVLPPQFFFMAPRLLYIQNYLQALVVAASLRSLTQLPPLTSTDSRGRDFMERVWTLLKSEIDEEDTSVAATKIINLADEVMRARRLVWVPPPGSTDEHEETKLRAAVDRTLQYGDPVFLLLQKRLLEALTKHLREPRDDSNAVPNPAPERMQTGRTLGAVRAEKRPRLTPEADSLTPPTSATVMMSVKGFEDPVLVHGIEEVLKKLYLQIRWVKNVWIEDGV